ncbi:hypothetical protein K438DRAFT_1783669 [Mycena galopus ATCC 62051]|nr:hypothetical protein K438DRAFT_1783669 [Mycena galopus ATCC 62051]
MSPAESKARPRPFGGGHEDEVEAEPGDGCGAKEREWRIKWRRAKALFRKAKGREKKTDRQRCAHAIYMEGGGTGNAERNAMCRGVYSVGELSELRAGRGDRKCLSVRLFDTPRKNPHRSDGDRGRVDTYMTGGAAIWRAWIEETGAGGEAE